MARQLVWLKWRLLVNGLRTDRQRQIGLPFILLGLIGIGWALSKLYRDSAAGLDAVALNELGFWVAAAGWVAWATLPVLIFPIDEALDPARFATLPFGRARMMVGLTGAGFLTPPILVPAMVFSVTLTIWAGPAVTPVAVVAVALIMANIVIGGQTFTTAFSMMVKSKRGRDLTMLFVVGLGLTLYVVQAVVAEAVGELGLGGALVAHPISSWAWLVPPGAAHAAILAAVEGRWLLAAGLLGWSLAGLAGLATIWFRLLNRLITQPEATTTRSASRMRPMTELAGWSAIGVIARKELRLYVRDPRLRMVWTGGVIFLGIIGASLLLGTTQIDILRRTPWMVMAAPTVVLFVGLPVALNQFGWERRAASFLFALPARPVQLLVGKNLATVVALTIETAALSLAIAGITGAWGRMLYVPAILITAMGCQLAVGNLSSVLTPLRLPDMGTDVFSQASEHGCLAIGSQVVSFFTIGILMVPPASAFVLAEWFPDRVPPPLVATLSVVWGLTAYLISLAISSRLLRRRIPEVLAWVQVV
ncbi:MAG: hypothetical protein OEO77_09325 [Acidimicrobiia bacterium]|nr:hypothetical protein [Acidimicrobiia bacterium]